MQHFIVKSKFRSFAGDNVVFALRIFGWLSIIGGIIAGVTLSDALFGEFNFMVFLSFSIYGGVSGVLLLGFAEVIELLKRIAMSEFTVDQENQGDISQPRNDTGIRREEPNTKKALTSDVGSTITNHTVNDKDPSDDSNSRSTVDVSQYSRLFSKR